MSLHYYVACAKKRMSLVDPYDGGSKRPGMDFVDQVTYDSRSDLMEVVCMVTSLEWRMVTLQSRVSKVRLE